MMRFLFSGQKEILYNYDMDINEQISAAYHALKPKITKVLDREASLVGLAVLCDLAEIIVTHLGDDTRAAGVTMIRTLYDNATTNRCGCGQVIGHL